MPDIISLEFLGTFFKNWATSANSKTDGKVPSLTEVLNERWRTSEKMSAFSLIVFVGISDSWHTFVWSRLLFSLGIFSLSLISK